MEDIKQYADLGVTAVICITFIFGAVKVFCYWLDKKKTNGGNFDKKIYEELALMNGNHLHTLQKTIVENNNDLIKTINSNDMKMIEILGEIKGLLSK